MLKPSNVPPRHGVYKDGIACGLPATRAVRNFACSLAHAWKLRVRPTRLPTTGSDDSLVESCLQPLIVFGLRPCLYRILFAKRMFSMYKNEFGGTARQTVDATPYRRHASEICVDPRCTLSRKNDVPIGPPSMLTAKIAVVGAIAVAPITLQVTIGQAFS